MHNRLPHSLVNRFIFCRASSTASKSETLKKYDSCFGLFFFWLVSLTHVSPTAEGVEENELSIVGGHKPLSFGFPAHFGSNCLCNYVANFPQQLRSVGSSIFFFRHFFPSSFSLSFCALRIIMSLLKKLEHYCSLDADCTLIQQINFVRIYWITVW